MQFNLISICFHFVCRWIISNLLKRLLSIWISLFIFFCSEINIRFLFNYDLILIQFFFLIKIPEIQYGKVKYTFILIFIETDENSRIKIFVEFIGNY